MIIFFLEMPKINKAKGNPVSRRLTQGFNATFLCDVESGYPKPNIEWWFEWSGKVKQVEVIHYPRYTHPTPNAWTITNIQPEDAGKYRCIATNEAGEDVQRFQITSVDSKLVSFKLSQVNKTSTHDTQLILGSR